MPECRGRLIEVRRIAESGLRFKQKCELNSTFFHSAASGFALLFQDRYPSVKVPDRNVGGFESGATPGESDPLGTTPSNKVAGVVNDINTQTFKAICVMTCAPPITGELNDAFLDRATSGLQVKVIVASTILRTKFLHDFISRLYC